MTRLKHNLFLSSKLPKVRCSEWTTAAFSGRVRNCGRASSAPKSARAKSTCLARFTKFIRWRAEDSSHAHFRNITERFQPKRFKFLRKDDPKIISRERWSKRINSLCLKKIKGHHCLSNSLTFINGRKICAVNLEVAFAHLDGYYGVFCLKKITKILTLCWYGKGKGKEKIGHA